MTTDRKKIEEKSLSKPKVSKRKRNSTKTKSKNKILLPQITKTKKKLEKELYTTKEVTIVMLFSIGMGILLCFGIISFISGKNYFIISKDLSKVVETYYSIADNYYGELDKKALAEGAIEGMMSVVGDSYTNYSNVEESKEFDEMINGSYEGIGCTIATYQEQNKNIIVEVFTESPAEKAGLKVGDIITKVDGNNVTSSTYISNYIKDSGKSKVVLTILRDDEEKEITVSLNKVSIPYVRGKLLEKNDKKIGYIAISLFSTNAYKQFKNELEKLEKENITGLVIDVRDNSGGYLTSVTNILNMFLEKGKIIYMLEDQSGTTKKKDTTKEKRTYAVAVLINNGSASASEILASAIKESYGGLVVGTGSYGKGSVQQTKKLLDGSMIKYTTQKWLTPNGTQIDGVGVIPTNTIHQSDEYFDNPKLENDAQLNEALNLLSK